MEYLFLQTSFAETKGMHTVCLKNLGVLQSVDIPWTGDFAAECHGQTVLFLNKEKPNMQKEDWKWGIFSFMLEMFLCEVFHNRIF